jgi:hypothetical protein
MNRYGPVAQSVEQWPFKPVVLGSNPSGSTTISLLRSDKAASFHRVEMHLIRALPSGVQQGNLLGSTKARFILS